MCPRPQEACLGAGVLPPPESLTWNLLCGLLPRLVGAAPALGQKGGRTTAEDKGHSFQGRPHPLPTSIPTRSPTPRQAPRSPEKPVSRVKAATHLTGALWGFPFTLAAMFGKHPELLGGKVLKESGKQIKTRAEDPTQEGLSQKTPFPDPAQGGKPSLGMLVGQGTLCPLGRLSAQCWSVSHGQARGMTGMRLAHTLGFRLASPEAAAKEGLLGGQEILAVQMGAEDSLLMRCGRRLAEGALSKGSRSSNTGPLSGHRGDSHCPPAAPVPSAQARPGTSHSLREDRDSWGKGTLRHSLAFLPRGRA